MPELKTIVVSFMSPGVSKGGGGFVIVNGKLKRIPPNSPKLKEVVAAFNLMAHSEEIANKRVRSQLTDISESLIVENVNNLVEEAGK